MCRKDRVGDTDAMRKANRSFSAAPEEGKIECGVEVIFGELRDESFQNQMKNINSQIQETLWTLTLIKFFKDIIQNLYWETYSKTVERGSGGGKKKGREREYNKQPKQKKVTFKEPSKNPSRRYEAERD